MKTLVPTRTSALMHAHASGTSSLLSIPNCHAHVAGFCSETYEVILVSPRNYFLYTPLLPAVATGTMEERSIVEPVRNLIVGKVGQKAFRWPDAILHHPHGNSDA